MFIINQCKKGKYWAERKAWRAWTRLRWKRKQQLWSRRVQQRFICWKSKANNISIARNWPWWNSENGQRIWKAHRRSKSCWSTQTRREDQATQDFISSINIFSSSSSRNLLLELSASNHLKRDLLVTETEFYQSIIKIEPGHTDIGTT